MDSVIKINSFFIIMLCVLQINCGTIRENQLDLAELEIQENTTTNNFSRITSVEEGRKKKEDLMSKILPMMVMPFMMQTAMLPMTLISMKFMLLKGTFLGKLAILFGAITLLRNALNRGGGLFSHNINVQQSHHHDLSHQSYGYNHRISSRRERKKRRKREISRMFLL